jgi:hypothetical protein
VRACGRGARLLELGLRPFALHLAQTRAPTTRRAETTRSSPAKRLGGSRDEDVVGHNPVERPLDSTGASILFCRRPANALLPRRSSAMVSEITKISLRFYLRGRCQQETAWSLPGRLRRRARHVPHSCVWLLLGVEADFRNV